MDRKKYIIIGAGLSGLAAASHLYKNGCSNLVVLEARDRIGGRVQSTTYGACQNSLVELGANWIHGATADNPLIVLANQAGVYEDTASLNRIAGNLYTADGQTVPPELFHEVWSQCVKWDADTGSVTSNDRISLRTYFENKIVKFIKTNPKLNTEHVRCVFNCYLNFQSFHQGTSLENIPIPETLYSDWGSPGSDVIIERGLSTLVQELYSQLPEGCVRLNREVKSIDYSKKVVVTCTNGEVYHGDSSIVTLPLGVLKHTHRSLFHPALPAKQLQAIQNIDFGRVNKIFLKWDRPFWNKIGSVKLGWSDRDVNDIQSDWCKRIFCFDEVHNNRNVLVCWISGDAAEYIEEIPDADLIDGCTDVLRKFLGNPDIPRPNSILHSNWCTDKYSRGSYSNVCFRTTPNAFDDLGTPICDQNKKPVILFAGEATDRKFYSTMTGAYRSGVKQVQTLLQSTWAH